MVTIDIKSVKQILQTKITNGHTKRLDEKKSKSFGNHNYVLHKNVLFSHLNIREILLG